MSAELLTYAINYFILCVCKEVYHSQHNCGEFLLEECSLEETNILKITHETIAGHMGTARDVVPRMLRYFQNEGMVKLARGTVEICEERRLQELSDT